MAADDRSGVELCDPSHNCRVVAANLLLVGQSTAVVGCAISDPSWTLEKLVAGWRLVEMVKVGGGTPVILLLAEFRGQAGDHSSSHGGMPG